MYEKIKKIVNDRRVVEKQLATIEYVKKNEANLNKKLKELDNRIYEFFLNLDEDKKIKILEDAFDGASINGREEQG